MNESLQLGLFLLETGVYTITARTFCKYYLTVKEAVTTRVDKYMNYYPNYNGTEYL